MEYKRLTKTNANYEKFIERVTGNKMSYLEYTMKEQKGEKVEMSLATLLYMVKMHQRLAELEDKIEQGTLVDTGAFYIDNGAKHGSNFPYIICKMFAEVAVYDYCFTREEAEKRLKELQE